MSLVTLVQLPIETWYIKELEAVSSGDFHTRESEVTPTNSVARSITELGGRRTTDNDAVAGGDQPTELPPVTRT